MGSNQNRHFDKGMLEWGSKARKREARSKKHAVEAAAIEDQLRADEDEDIPDDTCEQDADGMCICEPAPHRPPSKRRKKDTKRWCRGKVGKEHDWQPFDKWPGISRRWMGSLLMHRCQVCGKENWTFIR